MALTFRFIPAIAKFRSRYHIHGLIKTIAHVSVVHGHSHQLFWPEPLALTHPSTLPPRENAVLPTIILVPCRPATLLAQMIAHDHVETSGIKT